MAMSRRIGSELERSSGGRTGGNAPVLIGAVVVFTAIGLAASYAPHLLTPLLVVGAVVALPVLGARRGRAWGLRRQPGRADEAGLVPTHAEGELVQWVGGLLGPYQYRFERVEPDGPGIELIGRDPYGQLAVVQCLSNPPGERVGPWEILRLMAAVIQERAEGGILVTTTSFTRGAIILAGYSPVPIALYDGSALARPGWAGTAA